MKIGLQIHVIEMPWRRLLIGVAAAVLLGVFGVSAVKAWAPASIDKSGGPGGADVRVRTRCAECGVVESTREIVEADPPAASPSGGEIDRLATNGKPVKRYEITVRMRDGASRVFVDATPASWRPGERVRFIEGAGRSSD